MVVNFNKMKVAISGGLGGIGQEICKGLLENGVSYLAVLDLKEDTDTLKRWKNAFPNQIILFGHIDVTKRSVVELAIKQAKDKMGGLDMFINCSGILKDNDPDLTIQVNLLGTIYTTMAAVDLMGKHKGEKGGIIVNVASVLGLEPASVFAAYTASKHGVVGFTRSLSDEFHYDHTGIRYIIICPGITATNIIDTDLSKIATFEYAAEEATRFGLAKTQTADVCGKNILRAIQSGKNGSIWVCDLGTLKEVNLPVHWRAQF